MTSKKKRELNISQHEEIGYILRRVNEDLIRVYGKVGTIGYRNSPEAKALNKAVDALSVARSYLDDRMFREVPEEDLPKWPTRVYYGPLSPNSAS